MSPEFLGDEGRTYASGLSGFSFALQCWTVAAMQYLTWCKDLFPGLLVIIIINVEYCDENKDLVHIPLRIAVKHI